MWAAQGGDRAVDAAVRYEAAGGLARVEELLLRLIAGDAVVLHFVLQVALDEGVSICRSGPHSLHQVEGAQPPRKVAHCVADHQELRASGVPCAASAFAVARPMPPSEPVINADLPASMCSLPFRAASWNGQVPAKARRQ
jgi:hypothetical protein